MVERARLEIVYVLKKASRVRIPLSPVFAYAGWTSKLDYGFAWRGQSSSPGVRRSFSVDGWRGQSSLGVRSLEIPFLARARRSLGEDGKKIKLKT